MLIVKLPWPPSVNHYYRYVSRRVIISRDGREYRRRVCEILRGMDVDMLTGDVSVSVKAAPPDARRRDLDNIQKSLFDALQHGGVYKDDSQIKQICMEMFAPNRPDGCVVVSVLSIGKK